MQELFEMWISQWRRIKTDGGVDRLWHPAAEPRRTTQRLMITLNQSFGCLESSAATAPCLPPVCIHANCCQAGNGERSFAFVNWGMDP